jgi:hypothetical protein
MSVELHTGDAVSAERRKPIVSSNVTRFPAWSNALDQSAAALQPACETPRV